MLSWFWRRKADDQPTAAPERRRGLKVSPEAAAATRVTAEPVNPFQAAEHPPFAGKAGMSIAMDGAMDSANVWAANIYASAAATLGYQGSAFMGYPVLAELAQRPEYRMMSETIAGECTRRWIRFTAKNKAEEKDKAERITELEAEFKRLNVRAMFEKVAETDGYFGRAHISIDTGDSKNPNEMAKSIGEGWDALSKTKIGKGSIKKLKLIEPVWVYPQGYNAADPFEDGWYDPQFWNVMGRTVHKTRLLTFVGRTVPDLLKPAYSFGGVSLSQMAYPYVENWLKTRQGVNDIITAFTQFVLKTEMDAVLSGGSADNMLARAAMFNNTRSNRGLLMIDKEAEEFENVSSPLGGLDALQAQSQEHMASVSHIPTVKLLGIQPAGLNASSEGELRSFYDWIHSFQEKLYRQNLHALMGLVMLSLWGETDDGIDFEFEPLWSLDEKDLADVEKTKAETRQIDIDSGVVSSEEARSSLASDPDSMYQNLDPDKVPDLLDEEEEGLEPKGGKPIDELFDGKKQAA